jgi:DNA-binding MarR family transcriptional regulator
MLVNRDGSGLPGAGGEASRRDNSVAGAAASRFPGDNRPVTSRTHNRPAMALAPDDLHDLSHRPGFLLRKAHQVAVAIFSEEIGNLTLTPPQHNVLSALTANPGCHQTELGRIVGYDRATVGALLAGLETRELVERKGSEHDKRLKTLTLTRAGRQLLRASNTAMDRINRRILEPLAVHERPLFIALLARIAFSGSQAKAAAADKLDKRRRA